MFGLFKQPKHAGIKGFNSVMPNDNLPKKGKSKLRNSKSYGDIKTNVKPYAQPPVIHMPLTVESVEPVEYSVEKKTEQKSDEEKSDEEKRAEEKSNEEKKKRAEQKRAEQKRESLQELDLDETTRDLIAATLKQASKMVRHSPKKPATKRSKQEVKLAVLAKFESLAEKNPDFRNFIEDHPEYLETISIDELRESEYSRLDNLGHVYLDYTGGSLYPESLIRRHADILVKGVFGNPHSSNPTSSASTVYEHKVRQDILEFFGASPSEYEVVLTSNASGALKLIGESYPFSPNRKFLLTWDSHNSVNGIREFAKEKGSEVVYVTLETQIARINKELLKKSLDNDGKKEDCGLFALTGQSNVTGVKAELSWVKYAKTRGWDVLLDASALAPTTPIDLSKYPVDFMAVSFYKMFGYPTGVGCLVMRKETANKLRRPWFGGGTVDLVSVPDHIHTLSDGYKKFEDGTLNYLSLSAISLGLAFLRPIQKTLSNRITILTEYLIKELTSLRHGTTGPYLVSIAGPKNTYLRGGTISFFLIDATGTPIPHLIVEHVANKRKISLRSGCMCNPGAMTTAIGDIARLDHIINDMTPTEFVDSFDGDVILILRISVGIASNWEDCEAVLNLIKDFLDPVFYEEAKKEFGHLKVTSLC